MNQMNLPLVVDGAATISDTSGVFDGSIDGIP